MIQVLFAAAFERRVGASVGKVTVYCYNTLGAFIKMYYQGHQQSLQATALGCGHFLTNPQGTPVIFFHVESCGQSVCNCQACFIVCAKDCNMN